MKGDRYVTLEKFSEEAKEERRALSQQAARDIPTSVSTNLL